MDITFTSRRYFVRNRAYVLGGSVPPSSDSKSNGISIYTTAYKKVGDRRLAITFNYLRSPQGSVAILSMYNSSGVPKRISLNGSSCSQATCFVLFPYTYPTIER